VQQPPPYDPAPYGQAPPYQSPYVQQQQPSPYDPASYQQPYGQQQYWGSQPPQQGTNGMAIAALVLGIIWVFWLGSLLAVIFGHLALGQIKRSGQSGHGMALAGLILGYIGLAVFAFFFILGLAAGVEDST
jgi:hypothetical protein